MKTTYHFLITAAALLGDASFAVAQQTEKNATLKTAEGKLTRADKGDTFKVKKVDGKYIFQSSDGKFVGTSPDGKGLELTDSQDSALKVDIVEATAVASSPFPAAE